MPKATVTKTHQPKFAELLDFAHDLADSSGAAILPHFRKRLTIENKAGRNGFDPVTVADRGAERAIRRLIERRWPDHGIDGEEYGIKSTTSPYRWIIDPIDGTRAFVIGLPVWGTLIGLASDDGAGHSEPVLGIMDQPYTQERFWSDKSASYFRNADGKRRKLKTRSCPNIASAILTTTHPDLFNPGKQTSAFKKLKSEVRDTRYGGDCYSYCLLAAGHIDIVMESNLKAYDIAALVPIVERAGGTITTWTGEPAVSGGNIVASGDPKLHDKVLRLIN